MWAPGALGNALAGTQLRPGRVRQVHEDAASQAPCLCFVTPILGLCIIEYKCINTSRLDRTPSSPWSTGPWCRPRA